MMAIELYQNEVVTLSRAAEIADMNFFDFRAVLQARGIIIESPDETYQEIQQGVALILGDS
jgi:predicted HTH domain antitoxin